MQGDVSDEEVRQEYDEYRKELSAFLESPLINARADKFLTGDRYLYIFMCFGIRPDQNENPLAGGFFSLLWYRIPEYTKRVFKISNMIEVHTKLDLKVEIGKRRVTERKEMKMDIGDEEAMEVAEVELSNGEIQLYTFSKDGAIVLRVLFSVIGVEFPDVNWCNIQTPITEDAAAETARPDVDTKLQKLGKRLLLKGMSHDNSETTSY